MYRVRLWICTKLGLKKPLEFKVGDRVIYKPKGFTFVIGKVDYNDERLPYGVFYRGVRHWVSAADIMREEEFEGNV